MSFDDILQIAPFSLNKDEKETIMSERLLELTKHHL